jgi:hypothetical protein
MAVHENYLDGYLRYIKISMMGKSNEAQQGALSVIQGLMRFVRGLKDEDQTYDVVLDLIERLSRELPTVK